MQKYPGFYQFLRLGPVARSHQLSLLATPCSLLLQLKRKYLKLVVFDRTVPFRILLHQFLVTLYPSHTLLILAGVFYYRSEPFRYICTPRKLNLNTHIKNCTTTTSSTLSAQGLKAFLSVFVEEHLSAKCFYHFLATITARSTGFQSLIDMSSHRRNQLRVISLNTAQFLRFQGPYFNITFFYHS